VLKRMALLTAVVMLAFPALAGARIVVNKSIAGIKLGEAKSTVRHQLGAPAKTYPPSAGNQHQTQWAYFGRHLLVGFQNGHVVEVFTQNRKQRTASGVGVGSSRAAVKAHVKGVTCTHVTGFSGQECITSVRHGSVYWTTDFHVGPKGHVSSVLVNIFRAGGAVDRAMSALTR
jgi:hypothetical protein